MKVAKEEIIGLITALPIFVGEDEEAETRRYGQMCQELVDALIEIPGLRITVEHDEHDYLIPTAVIQFTRDWLGPAWDQVWSAMAKGDPPVFLHDLGNPDQVAVDPFNVSDEELKVVIRRLREELLR